MKILVEHLLSDQCENGEDANGVEEAATDQPKAKGINQYQLNSLSSLAFIAPFVACADFAHSIICTIARLH